ncbi:MAG: hypothetical protein WBB36_11185, partial [Chitinophagales bacterium]
LVAFFTTTSFTTFLGIGFTLALEAGLDATFLAGVAFFAAGLTCFLGAGFNFSGAGFTTFFAAGFFFGAADFFAGLAATFFLLFAIITIPFFV